MLIGINRGSAFFPQLRWLLLLAFPISSIPAFSDAAVAAAILPYSAIAMLACAILLHRLTSITPVNVSVCMVLGLFIVTYFLRYPLFVFAFDATPLASIQPDAVYEILRHDAASLHEAYALVSLVFSVFCVTAIALLRMPAVPFTRPRKVEMKGADAYVARFLVFLIPALMLLLGYVAHIYHIGQMGVAPGEPLPFRLKGVIFYGRLVVLPLLILTLVFLGDRLGNRWLTRFGLILLAVHGVSDMMLRGSRSSLLLCVMLAVFIVASRGLQVKRLAVGVSALIGVLGIWMMPVITRYRILRFTSEEDLLTVMAQALGSFGDGVLRLLYDGFMMLYFRIPGIETIWAILNLKAEPLGKALLATMTSSFGVTGYLNFSIYQIQPEHNTLFAPGYVGWWYLAGGWGSSVIGAFGLACLCILVPHMIFAARLRCAPVANTFLLWVVFISVTDATLDSNLLLIAAGMFTLGVLEVALRISYRIPTQVTS